MPSSEPPSRASFAGAARRSALFATSSSRATLRSVKNSSGFLSSRAPIDQRLQHRLGQPSLKEADHRVDAPGTALDHRPPAPADELVDPHRHLVERASGHQRIDLPGADPQIDHRPAAQVRAAARKPVAEIHVRLEVLAPLLAPERAGDALPRQDHRFQLAATLLQLPGLLERLGAALRDRDVPGESAVAVEIVICHRPSRSGRLVERAVEIDGDRSQ